MQPSDLPAAIAGLHAITLLLLAWVWVRKRPGHLPAERGLLALALASTAGSLAGYLALRRSGVPVVEFVEPEAFRAGYLAILTVHGLTTVAALLWAPVILRRVRTHTGAAMSTRDRRGFTLWTTSATTGVVAYLLLHVVFPQPQGLRLDPRSPGLEFEGVGACSAGASSRLLIDYPEPQRGQVLDLLFRPFCGAGFQHLKVEIGGDVNATDGCEPSHERERGELNFQRGYEWWLMTAARRRNPGIILDALPWGAPHWIGGGEFFSADLPDYITRFVQGAARVHNLEIAYVGLGNEYHGHPTRWIEALRTALDRAGLNQVRIVGGDQPRNWQLAEAIRTNAHLAAAIDILGAHYPGGYSTPAAQASGKRLWASEDGPWDGTWNGALRLARTLNLNYVTGRMTKTVVWSPVTAYYDCLPIPGSGVMRANTPWSGAFEVQPALWAVAHTTHFAQPGWRYLGGTACAVLAQGGSCVTLLAPNGQDFSAILESAVARAPQRVHFRLAPALRQGPLHVRRSRREAQFVTLDPIQPMRGEFTLTLEPHAIYSLTTLPDPQVAAPNPPVARPFPFPFRQDFEQEQRAANPRWFADQGGAFEVHPRADGTGLCLRQVISRPGLFWPGRGPTLPFTIVGDHSWTNYTVAVEARVADSGWAAVLGRVSEVRMDSPAPSGYALRLDATGAWTLAHGTNRIADGHLDPWSPGWHQLSLSFSNTLTEARINGHLLTSTIDPGPQSGMVGLAGEGASTEFDNLSVHSAAPRQHGSQ